MAPVCKFFIKGYCKFGDNCRFEHPDEESNSRGKNGFSFLSALNDVSHSQQSAPPQTNNLSGFSFTQALQTVKSKPDDVEMSDIRIDHGISFAPMSAPQPIVPQDMSYLNKPIVTSHQESNTQQDYSDLQTLSEEELRCFQSDYFQFRKIPIRPPPKTFC